MTDDVTDRFEQRLDKIETKIDRLIEAIADIKVIENRLTQHSESLARAFKKIEEHDRALDDLRERNAGADKSLAFAERLFWMVATASLGVVVYFLRDAV